MQVNYFDRKTLNSPKSISLVGPSPRGSNVESWYDYYPTFLEIK